MAIFLIYCIFFLVFFEGFLFDPTIVMDLGIPSYFASIVELLTVLLFIIAVVTSPRRRIPHLWHCLFFFLLASACSIVANESQISSFIFSVRLLFRYFVFYWCIILLSLDDNNLKTINLFLAILLILQLPVVALHFSQFGMNELTQGAYSKGGSVTTTLPITLLFYLAGFYFLYQPKIRYVLLGFGYVIFSIVGKKRAIAFLYPLQFLAIYYFIYSKGREVHISKKVGTFLLVCTTIVVVTGSIFYFNQTLNPEGEIGGSIDVGYAFSYAKDYTTAEHGYGYSTGRVSTTVRILESLWNSGIASFLFGVGPGAVTPSIFDSSDGINSVDSVIHRFKIGYGFTGFNRIFLEYGLLGVIPYTLIIILLARMCWRYYKGEQDPYWKAFAAGSVGFSYSMVFYYFAYSHITFWGDTIPAIYFYAMAVVYTRVKRESCPNLGINVSNHDIGASTIK